MEIVTRETGLPGVVIVEMRAFTDARGFFKETYHREKYLNAGIPDLFVQDNHSHSTQNIVRGLHYQLRRPQAKLVYVVSGEIYDVAVDIRRGSPTFGRWTGVRLSGQNHRQLYIPAGFAHGFCVISETADVLYKCSDLYAPGDEYGILWSDRTLGIDWPVGAEAVVSNKDRQFPPLDAVPAENLPHFPAQ